MAATRYVRYVGVAFLFVVILFFVTSPSAPTREQLQSSAAQFHDAGGRLIGKVMGPRPPGDTGTGLDVNQGQSGMDAEPGTSPNNAIDFPPATDPGPRVNATFVTLARNSDVWEISESIRQVEDRFNRKFNYDWVFLNDEPFDDTFKKVTTSLVSGNTKYGQIPHEHWSFPSWIDQDKAAAVREDMKQRKIIYGDSVSYRHMCRFESGFFYRQPLMMDYEFYWRVEPGIKLFCDIDYDVFRFMSVNNKKYSFVLSLYEYIDTIPTLWDSVRKFMEKHPEHIAEGNSMPFLSDDGGLTYNKCHFWSNFEIGSLEWLRSPAYQDYFDLLDQDGGFFYERWGDAPVHSIAAAVTLPKESIHFFDDIAYYHVPFTHCPDDEQTRLEKKCHCDPGQNFDWHDYSCTNRFFDLHGMQKPPGAPLTPRERRNRITLIVLIVIAVSIFIMVYLIKKLKKL